VLAAFAIIYLGSSYNTRPLRRLMLDGVVLAAGEQPPSRDLAAMEMRRIAVWAARRTPRDALMIAADPQLRAFGRRSLPAGASADLKPLYYLAPDRLSVWADRLARLRKATNPPDRPRAQPDAILRMVDAWRAELGAESAPAYILLETHLAPEPVGRLVRVEGPWGRRWQLYLIRPEGPPRQRPPVGPSAAPAGR
jgi:hypothetical protein